MCGIVGIVGHQNVNQQLYDALTVLQHRGQDAAGIVTSDGGKVHLRKGNGLVRDVFQQQHMQRLIGTQGIGHVRYPTAGSGSSAQAQPMYVNSPYGIVLAHSNESEWQAFRNNKNNEAFLDRVFIVKVPYCLRVSEEKQIYQKLLRESSLSKAPCAPGTLEMMAQFSVLTRIKEPENSNVFSKMPVKGFVVWDSHAFNLTKQGTSV